MNPVLPFQAAIIHLIYGRIEELNDPIVPEVQNSLQLFQFYSISSGEMIISLLKDTIDPSRTIVCCEQELNDFSAKELCSILRQTYRTAKIPFIIFVQNDEQLISALEAGADYVFCKPINPKELSAILNFYRNRLYAGKGSIRATEQASIIANRYVPERLLGKGGFARVYLAYDYKEDPPLPVALKTYDYIREDTLFRSKFLQEALELSRIHHPNVVKFYDFGKTEDVYFLVTEYINGWTLEEALNEFGVLNEYQASLIGYYVGRALREMSHLNIVHRDLNPKNIMLTRDGDVKIVDFGLAKTIAAATCSTDDHFQATPYYVAPEYILNEEVSVKTDIYSLAATLYVVLTNIYPFPGETPEEVLNAHLSHTPQPLIELVPNLSPDFSDLIQRCLSRDPADRPDINYFIGVMKKVYQSHQANHEADSDSLNYQNL